MGAFKQGEIDEVDSDYIDPNQLKLIPDEPSESRAMAPSALPLSQTEITRPGKLTVKDIRYIEEFLSKRLKVG